MQQDRGLAALQSLLNVKAGPQAPKQTQAMQARILTDMLPVIRRANPFSEGTLVVQGRGRAVLHMHEDTLFIITHVYEPKPTDEARENSPYPREDMLIACLVDCPNGGDQHWREIAVESWRFDKYSGPIE